MLQGFIKCTKVTVQKKQLILKGVRLEVFPDLADFIWINPLNTIIEGKGTEKAWGENNSGSS